MSLSHLRPLAFGEILDGAFTLYRRHFVPMFVTALVPSVPISLASAYFSFMTVGKTPDPFAAIGLFFLMMVATALAAPFMWAALTREFSDAYTGAAVSVGGAFGRALRALGPVLLAGIVIMVGAVALIFTAMIPVFILGMVVGLSGGGAGSVAGGALMLVLMIAVYLGVISVVVATMYAVVPAVVLERLGPLAAMSRSLKLSRGAWARAVGVFFVAWLVTVLPMIGVALLTGSFRQMIDPSHVPTLTQLFVQQVFAMLGGAFTTPFMVGCFVLLYYDRRVRTEAYDLQAAAEALSPA